jgi:RHS repeat-associated protein
MPTSYGFTGQRQDTASGLDYYGARYYDPLIGQFAGADTISVTGILGLSRYAYVEGNPIGRTDPTGHKQDEGGGDPSCIGYCAPPPPPPPTTSNVDPCGGQCWTPPGGGTTYGQPPPAAAPPPPSVPPAAVAPKPPDTAQQAILNFINENSDAITLASVGASLVGGALSLAAGGCAGAVGETGVGLAACGGIENVAIGMDVLATGLDASLFLVGKGSRADLALDSLVLVPGFGAASAGAKATKDAALFGRTLRAGENAWAFRKSMEAWRGVQGEFKELSFVTAAGNAVRSGWGLLERAFGL